MNKNRQSLLFFIVLFNYQKTQKNFSYLFFSFITGREKTRFFSLYVSSLSSAKSTLTSTLYPVRRNCLFISSLSTNPKMFRPRKMGLLIGRSRSNRPVRYTQGDRQQKTKRDIDTHTHTYTLCLYSSLYVFRIPIQIASHDCELSLGWQLCLPHFLDLVGSLLIKKNILQGHQEMVRDVFLLELI